MRTTSSIEVTKIGGDSKGRWENDIRVLESELEANPHDQRSAFYLAQTHRDLGRTIGPVVLISVRDEKEIGRGRDPDAAKTHFQAGDVGNLVTEDLAGIKVATAVLVLKD